VSGEVSSVRLLYVVDSGSSFTNGTSIVVCSILSPLVILSFGYIS